MLMETRGKTLDMADAELHRFELGVKILKMFLLERKDKKSEYKNLISNPNLKC